MGRVVGLEELVRRREEARREGRTTVFTNGHFDLLHVGHLRYLAAARALGDLLIVALNDDAGTARLKGPLRPIVPEGERAESLAALAAVDYVTLFEEDTPAALIAALRPEVYVKGGDYTAAPGQGGKPLPEAAIVRGYGGEVRVLPLTPERSTSGLIERILARYCPTPLSPPNSGGQPGEGGG